MIERNFKVAIHESDAFARDPEILAGTLCLRGTRMPVSHIASYIAAGFSNSDIVDQYPTLTDAQLEAVRSAISVESA